MIIEVTGPIASGKTTLVKNLDRDDVIKSRKLKNKRKINYMKFMISSKFFRKNFFLILRVSWLTKWKTTHAFKEIVHYLYHAEKFDRENKLALWEEGIVCRFLNISDKDGFKQVTRLRKKIIKKYPTAVIIVELKNNLIRIERLKKRNEKNGKELLEKDGPLKHVTRHYKMVNEDIKKSIIPLKDQLVELRKIYNDSEFQKGLNKFNKAVEIVEKKGFEKKLI